MIKLSTGLRQALLGTNDFKTIFTDSVLKSIPVPLRQRQMTPKPARNSAALPCLRVRLPQEPQPLAWEFGTPSAGVIAKASAEVWSGVNLATGTAGYYRLYANALRHGVFYLPCPSARERLEPQGRGYDRCLHCVHFGRHHHG